MAFIDDTDFDDDDDLDELQGQNPEQLIATLRKVAKDSKKALKEVKKEADKGKDAQRKLALLEAKLPEDDPKIKYFLDHYEGDYTAEAIRAKAAEHGFIEPDVKVKDEVNTIEGVMQAASGATMPPAPGSDDALMAEIRGVKETGEAGAQKIKEIMQRYGRYVEDDD